MAKINWLRQEIELLKVTASIRSTRKKTIIAFCCITNRAQGISSQALCGQKSNIQFIWTNGHGTHPRHNYNRCHCWPLHSHLPRGLESLLCVTNLSHKLPFKLIYIYSCLYLLEQFFFVLAPNQIDMVQINACIARFYYRNVKTSQSNKLIVQNISKLNSLQHFIIYWL